MVIFNTYVSLPEGKPSHPPHGRFVVGCATSDDEHVFFKFFACATIVTGKLLMVWQGNRYIDIHRYPSFPKNWEYYAWEGGEQPPWRWNSGTEVPEFSDETLSDDLPKAWWERWGERKWTSHGPEPVPIRWTCSGAILNFQTFSSRLLQMSLVPTSIQVVVFFRPRRRAFATPRNQWQLLAGGALRGRLPATLWAFPGAACHVVPTAQWAAGTLWGEDEPETCYLFWGGLPCGWEGAKELW